MTEPTPGDRIEVRPEVTSNSSDYFTYAMIRPTGFREYDVRWRIIGDPPEINISGFVILGKAFGTYMRRRTANEDHALQALVGHDFRSYSQNVKNAFALGLLSSGVDIVDIGLVTTPALYFAQHHLDIPHGAMITASHNENGWTGIKLAHGLSMTFEPPEIGEFKDLVYSGRFAEGAGRLRAVRGILDAHIEDLISGIRVAHPLKVVVNTGNGTAGLVTPEAFRRAGFEVVEIHTNLDWDFPNYNPNPENIAFLQSIGEKVRAVGADLGVGIDGDGDRLGIVDDRGEEVFSDKIGVLTGQHLLPEVQSRGETATFVVDVKSTNLYEKILRPLGAEIIWEKTGHSYIKAAVRTNEATAGFERSGHMFFRPPYGRGYDDGTLAGLIFASLLSQKGIPLSRWVAELPRSYQSPNMQPHCSDETKRDVVASLRTAYEQEFAAGKQIAGALIKELITINGIRVRFTDDSWFLVRASSNTPTLVVLGESFTTRRRLYDMMNEVMARLRQFPEVGDFDQTLPPYPGED
ncbi:hypothetical protein AMJ39_03995 [candidate division TA06 bacterium DG_24]|uniref:Phosphoglucomutase n=3 Tax=Bacteria division TA06 TaxID=1156500 RepID=A0A0S8JMJ2_UNCT6|nr:MAG: hypothetical protein AMJ39_03995 [candidate division TA06 bacterium DG_24]KPK70653.1 MAG: hypothetical protein AMJ82_02590 [candidate division TA06 bacterium SM23_40]KPL10943.1 MAG: hypothetical protein AMJ71_01350 [candidate division TA06 bacterium SM1_40]